MFCKECGTEIKPGARFCVKCGTKVKVPETESQKTLTEEFPKIEVAHPQQNTAGLDVCNQNKAAGSSKVIIIVLVCIIILLLGAGGAMFFYFNGQNNRQESSFEDQERREYNEENKLTDNDGQIVQATETTTEKSVEEQTPTEKIAETEQIFVQDDTEYGSGKVHTYQIITADVTWTEAYQAARNIPNGHLVNIDTEEEWNAIVNQIEEQGYGDCIFWIGAMRNGDSQEYYWIDENGKSVGDAINGSSHWLAGEPTFYDSENELEERYVEMFYSGKQDAWVWNDTPDDLLSLISYYSGKIAYIVEIED